MTTIEFTDRYGGHAPSWLRGCHGECEAMGWVPLWHLDRAPMDTELVLTEALTPSEMDAWREAHEASDETECDGWHFVKCSGCHGTGRVSWLRTVARVPRWLAKGSRFVVMTMTTPTMWPEGWSWQRKLRLALWSAYGADVRTLRR